MREKNYFQKKKKLQKYVIKSLDLEILKMLVKNSSQPYSIIAKKLGKSSQMICYRIKQLIKKGVILKFYTMTNLKLLEFHLYIIELKIKNPEKITEVFSFLNYYNLSNEVFQFKKNSILCTIPIKKPSDINYLFISLKEKFREQILSFKILVVQKILYSNFYPIILEK